MKTRQSPRRGNLGSALSSYSDEQKIKSEDSATPVPTPPPATDGANHPGQPMTRSETPLASAAENAGAGTGTSATVVSDTTAIGGGGEGRSGSIDFRARSDTFGSLGITLDDFRGRSETLGSAADVLADCLGPFPSVLDVNVQALPPDQRQVYSVNQAQALHQQYQAAQQGQQQVPTSGALPVPRQIGGGGGGGGSNPGSQPSSQGSASGFLSPNFGNATKVAAASAAGGSSNQKIPAGGIAHTPPSALGPASYETKHFGKRMRAGSISGRLRSASDLEDRGIIDRAQKGIIKDLIISGDDALQTALDRYEQGDKSELENMIKSGRLQSYQSGDGAHGSSNIDILGDLDLDFLTVGDDLGGIIGHMDMDEAPNSGADGAAAVAAAAGPNHPGAPTDDIGDLDFNADYSEAADHYDLPASGSHAGNPVSGALGTQGDGRWRANSLAFGGLLNEMPPPQTPSAYSNWMDDPDAMGEITLDANGELMLVGGGKNLANLTKKQERELKKSAKEKEKREKKLKKEQEKKARAEEKARRRSLSPKSSKKKDDKSKSRRSLSPKSGRNDEDNEETKEPTPSGLGLPRSMSDPNLRVGLDKDGLLCVAAPEGWVGAYSPDSRKIRIDRFLAKRQHRVWTKKVKYDVRKNFADSRLRVKGRFVKKEDELLMRDLMSLT